MAVFLPLLSDFTVKRQELGGRVAGQRDEAPEVNSGHDCAEDDCDEPPANRESQTDRLYVEYSAAERCEDVTRQRKLPELVVRDRETVGRCEDADDQSRQKPEGRWEACSRTEAVNQRRERACRKREQERTSDDDTDSFERIGEGHTGASNPRQKSVVVGEGLTATRRCSGPRRRGPRRAGSPRPNRSLPPRCGR